MGDLRTTKVAVIGGGAAGIAAAMRLRHAGIACVVLEARSRLGGRAHTIEAGGYPLDLGCGWLHSADRNPWIAIAQECGFHIDKTPPPWQRPSHLAGFPVAEQRAFQTALNDFYECADTAPLQAGDDPPLSHFLTANDRWNPLINAVSSYFSGAELDRISTRDLRNYKDSEVNWRIDRGYGAAIAAYGRDLDTVMNCTVQSIDWDRMPVRVITSAGVVECDAAIVTLPTPIVAQQAALFSPRLPEKTAAAAGLPLGLADKLYLSLDNAEEFEPDSRLYGCKDRTDTAIYHARPFGRPLIECYFGGSCADALERGGKAAFFDFAKSELVALMGSDFGRRIKALSMHLWRTDPFALGAYSYALPGHAEDRATLAAPVAERLFFAGEACSAESYSTAHGALETGIAAANQIIALGKRASALR